MPRSTARVPRRRAGIKATAEYAGVCEKTVRNWIASGRITGYRVGPKLIRCDLDELDATIRPVAVAGGDAA